MFVEVQMHDLILSRMKARDLSTAADLHRAMTGAPSSTAVRAWVAGSSMPGPQWWPSLAAALGVTVAALSEAHRLDMVAQADGAA